MTDLKLHHEFPFPSSHNFFDPGSCQMLTSHLLRPYSLLHSLPCCGPSWISIGAPFPPPSHRHLLELLLALPFPSAWSTAKPAPRGLLVWAALCHWTCRVPRCCAAQHRPASLCWCVVSAVSSSAGPCPTSIFLLYVLGHNLPLLCTLHFFLCLGYLLPPCPRLRKSWRCPHSSFMHVQKKKEIFIYRERSQRYELCEGWAGRSDAILWKQAITFIGTAQ